VKETKRGRGRERGKKGKGGIEGERGGRGRERGKQRKGGREGERERDTKRGREKRRET
jgi:hypothetical protein